MNVGCLDYLQSTHESIFTFRVREPMAHIPYT